MLPDGRPALRRDRAVRRSPNPDRRPDSSPDRPPDTRPDKQAGQRSVDSQGPAAAKGSPAAFAVAHFGFGAGSGSAACPGDGKAGNAAPERGEAAPDAARFRAGHEPRPRGGTIPPSPRQAPRRASAPRWASQSSPRLNPQVPSP